MPICYGAVISKKLPKLKCTQEEGCSSQSSGSGLCYECFKLVEEKQKVTCLEPSCSLICHIICMSKYFLSEGQYVPVEGQCPKCKSHYLWGDIVRKYKGCYGNVDLKINVEDASEFYGSDQE